VLGVATPGYSHETRLISELGQEGAPYAPVWRGILILAGGIATVFAYALHFGINGGKGSRLGPWMIASIGAGLVLGGVFRCDPACVPVTFSGWAHILTSIPGTLSALVAPFVFAGRMRADRGWKDYIVPSQLAGVLSIGSILAAYFYFGKCGMGGTGQRIATGVQLAWLSMMAIGLVRTAAGAQSATRPRVRPTGARGARL
jgi:hypothetical membrane protein